MDSKEFIANVRRALGRDSGGRDAGTPPTLPDVTHLSLNHQQVESWAQAISRGLEAHAEEYMAQLEKTAAEAGWRVARCVTAAQAANHIRNIVREVEAKSVLRSGHSALDALNLEAALHDAGASLEAMVLTDGTDREMQRDAWRRKAISADVGITGVDYAIAETGTAVLLGRKGVSRVVSLLPPVHIAVVEKGQVLPSLDELFTLRRKEFLNDNLGSYMTLISGPSRSADIENTLVTGVHGPGEVHMVLVG